MVPKTYLLMHFFPKIFRIFALGAFFCVLNKITADLVMHGRQMYIPQYTVVQYTQLRTEPTYHATRSPFEDIAFRGNQRIRCTG